MTAVNTNAALQAELDKLKAENAALKSQQTATVRFKVSDKGAMSVYGLGRFPITLYKSQWEVVLSAGFVKAAMEFMDKNKGTLKVKGE